MRASKETPAETRPEVRPSRETAGLTPEKLAEHHEREALRGILSLKGLDPSTALEIVATYDRSSMTDDNLEDVRLLAGDFGLELESLDPAARNELLTLHAATDKILSEGGKAEVGRAMNEIMREKLQASAFAKVDGLRASLESSESLEQLTERYGEIMKTVTDLARQMPPEVGVDDKVWRGLYARMRDAVEAKNGKGLDPKAAEAMRGVLSEFEGEIEDEFINRELARLTAADKPHSVEHLMAKVYGRTPEEIEAIKARNREAVAAEILRLKDDPEISIETLEKLHALNNRGIVPKSFSRLREKDEGIVFGKRIGLHAEDARVEIEALLARAEALIGKDIVKGVSDPVYQIAVAKMHNDLLDIHPFPDRNGSTAALFMELMMSKKGYVPEAERPESYYGGLRKVLGDNPLALGLVGYQHFKIHNVGGHYEGETVMNDKEKADIYGQIAKEHAKDVAARRTEIKKEEKRKKKP